MNYLIWVFGFVVGGCVVWIITSRREAAYRADHAHDLWKEFMDGFNAGMDRPGCTLAGVADPQNKTQGQTDREVTKRLVERYYAAKGLGK